MGGLPWPLGSVDKVAHSFRLADGSLSQKLIFGGCIVALAALGLIRFMQGSSWVSFLPLLVLVPLGTFAFRGVWNKRPVLTHDSTGIWFKSWESDKPLPWPQIRKIELLTIGPGDPFVGFFLQGEDPHKLPKNSIRVSQLNVRTKTVYEIALDYWRQFGPNSALQRTAVPLAELDR